MNTNHVETVAAKRRTSGAFGWELLVGLAVALACSVLWALIAHQTHQELIYASPLIGLVIGLAVAISARVRSIDNGVSAAGLTAITVLLGKLLIVQWGLTSGATVTESVSQQTAPVAENVTANAPSAEPEQDITGTTMSSETIPVVHASDMQRVSRIKSALTTSDLLWLSLSMALAFLLGIGLRAGKARPAAGPVKGRTTPDIRDT